jgi:hypothetical protein
MAGIFASGRFFEHELMGQRDRDARASHPMNSRTSRKAALIRDILQHLS